MESIRYSVNVEQINSKLNNYKLSNYYELLTMNFKTTLHPKLYALNLKK